MSVIGLDLGLATVPEAERWLADLPPALGHPAGLVACTHLVHGHRPRVVITLATPEPIDPARLPRPGGADRAVDEDAVQAAAGDHVAGRAGRAVIYPGVEGLRGSVTVADLLASSAIERIVLLGLPGVTPDPGTVVDTRDFVRPQWMDGTLTLVAAPAPAGRIAPFEVPNPTPCCADHP